MGTEDESMTKRNPTRKRKRKQVRHPSRQAVPLTERIRIRHWGRHESLKQIARALRIPIGKVERAVKPSKPRKPKRGGRKVRGAGGEGRVSELERVRAENVRLKKRLRKKRQVSAAKGLVDQSVRKLFAEKLGKPGAYTIEAWRRELGKMSHEERVAFIKKHYKKISAQTGLSPKEVFSLGISP